MMEKLDLILQELGISKVRLAKYLGVSRQMVYNYLEMDDLNLWPKEKKMKLFKLLDIKSTDEIKKIKINSDYIMEVEGKLNQGVKATINVEDASDFKGLNKRDQELLTDIIHLLKEKLTDDKTKDTANTLKYLYYFLQSIGTSKELKYMLAYVSKSVGFTSPLEFAFNEEQQFTFESIFYSAMTLYNNGGASKTKIAESHKRFVQEIEHRNEEKLSRTQELNSAKVQALKELGYTEINEENAKEVLEKIAEIQSRKV
jgi:transcriptional regulator with XRE-family HTH domain